jgi:hypothetical protein
MTTRTGKSIKSHGADIVTGMYEGGFTSCWAVGLGDYTWSDETETASVTLFERGDDMSDEEAWTNGKPLFISETIVADYIKLMGTTPEGIKTLKEKLNERMVKDIIVLNVLDDYDLDWDAIDYDALVQLILLGEVRYG